MKRKTVYLKELIPLLQERFKKGKASIIQIKGTSMRPFYKNGKTLVKLIPPKTLSKGDAVLFISENGQYVLHRIVKIKKDASLIICGDGNFLKDKVPSSNVIARVKAHSHNGEDWVLERSQSFQRKVMIWQTLKPFRKILMRLKRFNHKEG